MFNYFHGSTSPSRQEFDLPMPRPGEIWELNRLVRSPREFSSEEQQQLYSDAAKRFIEGQSPPRYVMIVGEPDPLDVEEEWQVVSVMVLSVETYFFLSDVDLLLPTEVSDVEQDLLAETWHVMPMLVCNLLRPVGQRLSRKIYDVLLSVGDYYHGLVDEVPSKPEIEALGLGIATVSVKQQQKIQEFHHQESVWSEVLSVPVAAYHTYLKAIGLTNALLDEALQLERELKE